LVYAEKKKEEPEEDDDAGDQDFDGVSFPEDIEPQAEPVKKEEKPKAAEPAKKDGACQMELIFDQHY
jgi:hypothetical protein